MNLVDIHAKYSEIQSNLLQYMHEIDSTHGVVFLLRRTLETIEMQCSLEVFMAKNTKSKIRIEKGKILVCYRHEWIEYTNAPDEIILGLMAENTLAMFLSALKVSEELIAVQKEE